MCYDVQRNSDFFELREIADSIVWFETVGKEKEVVISGQGREKV